MRTMYKEEVARKKLPSVFGIFILLLFVICISDVVEKIYIADKSIGVVTNPLFMIVMTAAAIFVSLKCKEKYKYSIIADQLIIHNVIGREQVVVENIKLKDIEYIGRVKELMERFDVVSTKKYVCTYSKASSYCCIYKDEKKYKKFYFQPSENFVNKINSLIENEKKLAS